MWINHWIENFFDWVFEGHRLSYIKKHQFLTLQLLIMKQDRDGHLVDLASCTHFQFKHRVRETILPLINEEYINAYNSSGDRIKHVPTEAMGPPGHPGLFSEVKPQVLFLEITPKGREHFREITAPPWAKIRVAHIVAAAIIGLIIKALWSYIFG